MLAAIVKWLSPLLPKGNVILLSFLFLIVILIFRLSVAVQEIKSLNLQINEAKVTIETLSLENKNLKLSSVAVRVAADAQSVICFNEAKQRDYIDDLSRRHRITEKPQGVIDEKTSHEAVIFLNTDIFAPLGRSLRGSEDANGR